MAFKAAEDRWTAHTTRLSVLLSGVLESLWVSHYYFLITKKTGENGRFQNGLLFVELFALLLLLERMVGETHSTLSFLQRVGGKYNILTVNYDSPPLPLFSSRPCLSLASAVGRWPTLYGLSPFLTHFLSRTTQFRVGTCGTRVV